MTEKGKTQLLRYLTGISVGIALTLIVSSFKESRHLYFVSYYCSNGNTIGFGNLQLNWNEVTDIKDVQLMKTWIENNSEAKGVIILNIQLLPIR